MIPIRVHGNAGSHEDTIALCDTGSSQTWVDQELLEKLNLDGEEVTIHVAGIHAPLLFRVRKLKLYLGRQRAMPSTSVGYW